VLLVLLLIASNKVVQALIDDKCCCKYIYAFYLTQAPPGDVFVKCGKKALDFTFSRMIIQKHIPHGDLRQSR